MNILPTPFFFTDETLTFLRGAHTLWKIPWPGTEIFLEQFGGSFAARPRALPSSWARIPGEEAQVWSCGSVQPTQISPLFLQELYFLQASVGSRGQCAVLSLVPLNLVWDLFLVKIAGGSKKRSSRRPLLSVCFHPCLGNTMNADVVGNFWLSIGLFCGKFKALWLVIL